MNTRAHLATNVEGAGVVRAIRQAHNATAAQRGQAELPVVAVVDVDVGVGLEHPSCSIVSELDDAPF